MRKNYLNTIVLILNSFILLMIAFSAYVFLSVICEHLTWHTDEGYQLVFIVLLVPLYLIIGGFILIINRYQKIHLILKVFPFVFPILSLIPIYIDKDSFVLLQTLIAVLICF